MNETRDIADLKAGDTFIDSELTSLFSEDLSYNIIGDHLYAITDGHSRMIISADHGNGNGIVLTVIDYNEMYAKGLELTKDGN